MKKYSTIGKYNTHKAQRNLERLRELARPKQQPQIGSVRHQTVTSFGQLTVATDKTCDCCGYLVCANANVGVSDGYQGRTIETPRGYVDMKLEDGLIARFKVFGSEPSVSTLFSALLKQEFANEPLFELTDMSRDRDSDWIIPEVDGMTIRSDDPDQTYLRWSSTSTLELDGRGGAHRSSVRRAIRDAIEQAKSRPPLKFFSERVQAEFGHTGRISIVDNAHNTNYLEVLIDGKSVPSPNASLGVLAWGKWSDLEDLNLDPGYKGLQKKIRRQIMEALDVKPPPGKTLSELLRRKYANEPRFQLQIRSSGMLRACVDGRCVESPALGPLAWGETSEWEKMTNEYGGLHPWVVERRGFIFNAIDEALSEMPF